MAWRRQVLVCLDVPSVFHKGASVAPEFRVAVEPVLRLNALGQIVLGVVDCGRWTLK